MKRKINTIISVICALALLTSTTVIYADIYTNEDSTKQTTPIEITSITQLKDEIAEIKAEKGITQRRLIAILEKTDDVVVEEFRKEKQEDSVKAMNAVDIDKVMEIQPDGSEYGKKVLDIGDGCSVVVEFEDRAVETVLGSLLNTVVEPCYAASNGKPQWKDYGNRYFTARSTMPLGMGVATMSVQNHYNLSSSGIKERDKGVEVLSCSSISINGGTVANGFYKVTDWTATKPGASDVNAYGQWGWSTAVLPGELLYVGSVWRIHTTIGYLAKDTTNKQIEVKHSWRFE